MGFELAPFGPGVGLVVVIDIAQEQAIFAFVDDQADVTGDAHRPEVFVSGSVELVEAHTGVGRVDLQIECRGFDGLLFLGAQAR
jgi:hypothetical protein